MLYTTHNLSLVFFNIILYIIVFLNIFILFFLYDTRYFRTLNEFKGFSSNNAFQFILVLSFLSLAGIPPFLGFFGKFLIIIFFFLKKQYLIFALFFFFNCFVIYFYIINVRYLVTKTEGLFYFITNYTVYLNFNFILLLLLFSFFNFFGIFFMNDLIVFSVYLWSFNF